MSISDEAAAIFAEAQELDAGERAGFVRTACSDDQELFDEVMSLLTAAEQAEPFFDRVSQELSTLAVAGRGVADNTVIGRWRVRSRLGRGGMGAVYRVERADKEFEQQAALKILPLGLDGDDARARFLRERQILAGLQHENIAHLIDGGISDEDLPYFVMDYVDGAPIDQYCDDERLGIEDRVRLFLGVLAAVGHAHSRFVVHRDIKPSNVFVNKSGVVKLLDFGVARLLSDDAYPGQTRVQALTPEYAAPEQLRGEAATTATDVYSLGLLLYTILAGRNPRHATDEPTAGTDSTGRDVPRISEFATDVTSLDEDVVRALLARRRTSVASLRRALAGDLDNILDKALRSDPEERYQTALEFSADLQRFLDDEPVQAGPPTVTYKVGKFVRRHRGGVAVAALVLVALVGATIITAWQAYEANRQREIALYNQQRVEATNQFIRILLTDVSDRDEPLSTLELLDRGVDLLESNYGVEERFLANTLFQVSGFYGALGERDKRIELLDRAIEIARQHRDDQALSAMLCSRARNDIFSDRESARADIDEGQEILDRIRPQSSGESVACLRSLARLQAADGDRELAIATLNRTLDLIADNPVNPQAVRATILNDLGEHYFNSGRPADALVYLDEALDIRDRIGLGGITANLIDRLNKAAVLSRLGEVYEAAGEQRVVLERLETLGRPLVGSKNHYGNSLMQLGRYDEALSLFTQELDDAEASGNVRWTTHNQMQIGRTLLKLGRYAEAEEYLVPAEDAYRNGPAPQQRMLVTIALSRVEAQLERGEIAAAKTAIDDILEGMNYPAARDATALEAALRIAAATAIAANNHAAAERYASDAFDLALGAARDAESSSNVGRCLLLRGEARLGLKEIDAARADLGSAVIALRAGFGPDHGKTRIAEDLLASLGPD